MLNRIFNIYHIFCLDILIIAYTVIIVLINEYGKCMLLLFKKIYVGEHHRISYKPFLKSIEKKYEKCSIWFYNWHFSHCTTGLSKVNDVISYKFLDVHGLIFNEVKDLKRQTIFN